MGCVLDRFTTYSVARVVQDDNGVTAQLVEPPASCPDKSFHSKKAEVRVQAHVGPTLTFDMQDHVAVVTVPKKDYVEDVRSSFGVGSLFLILFVISAVIAVGSYYFFQSKDEAEEPEVSVKPPVPPPAPKAPEVPKATVEPTAARVASPTPPSNHAAPVPPPHYHPPAAPAPTVVVTQAPSSGVGDLALGMALGHIMSSGGEHTHTTERVIEREVVREVPESRDFSSDTDSSTNSDSSSTFSSDDDGDSSSSSSSSFSSDSSSDSSYSSDSSSDSSYSSDSSSSDFSSDY